MVRHQAYELVARELKMRNGQSGSCVSSVDINNNSNKDENKENESCPIQVHIWKEDEEKMLLDLRLALDIDFNSSKNHETLWKKITEELHKNDIKVTKVQARNKFKGLKKKYREIVDENSKTGNSPHKWKYFEVFQAAYGHKTSTTPASTFDSSATDKTNINTKGKTAASSKRKRQSVDRVIDKIDQTNSDLMEEMKREHTDKMARMDRFLDIYEKSAGSTS